MTMITNTYDTYTSKRGRETLSDMIYRIDPEETPFQSNIGSETVDGVNPQWNLDTLATPIATNARPEGDQYTLSAVTATVKVGNYTQISMKEFSITETEERVAKAGPRSDFNREMVKKGIELRTDIEVQLLSNTASYAGTNAAARTSAGARAWIATNDDLGATGTSGGWNGTLVAASGLGTQRLLTKTMLDSVLSLAYTGGGNPKILMGAPFQKTTFSTFMNTANVVPLRSAVAPGKQATIIGAADEYLSDFGLVTFVVNRQMARAGATIARNLFVIDPKFWAVGWLRPIQKDPDAAKSGDALPGILKCEYTLISRNEKASGVVADLTTS